MYTTNLVIDLDTEMWWNKGATKVDLSAGDKNMSVPMAVFQQPNTEKAFIEYLSQHITTLPPTEGSKQFLEAFKEVYGVHLEESQLKDILRNLKSAKHRGLVIRPVLNQILRGKVAYPEAGLGLPLLGKNQLDTIAELFDLKSELMRISAENATAETMNPFKMLNPFELTEETGLDDHSFKKLKEEIAIGIFKTPSNQVPNLNPILRNFELEKRAKQQEEGGTLGVFQKMLGQLPSIVNPMGIGGPNNFFVFIGQLFSKMLSPLLTMFSSFIKNFKTIGQRAGAEDAPLAEPDIKADPEIAKETGQFAELCDQLSDFGGIEGKRIAGELNKKWRKDPNAVEVWADLISAMIENDLVEEADQWLRKQEKRLLDEVINIEEKLQKEMSVSPVQMQLLKALKQHKDNLSSLNDPVLAYASKPYKKENFILRFDMFKQSSAEINKIHLKHREELETILRVKEQEEIKKNVQSQELAARNSNLAPILQERLVRVEKELYELNGKLEQSQRDSKVETYLLDKVHPTLIKLFDTHKNRLDQVKNEARDRKKFEEAASKMRI